MTFRQIGFFVAVCECRSISKASEILYVSQQGISKAIRELEDEMGCELLCRTNSGVTLTQYGSYVLKECQLIMRKKEYMTSHIRQMKASPKEPLMVGMAYGVIATFRTNVLRDFEISYPDISLNYMDHPDYVLEDRLRKEEYDLAVSLGPVDCEDFDVEILRKEKVYLCIPKKHPLNNTREIYMSDLREQKFVMFSAQFHIYHNFMASCRHAGFEPNIVVSSSDFNSLKELALCNNSLFVVPEHTIRNDDPQIRYYPFPDPYYTWDVCFVTKKNKLMTESIVAFHNHLKACYDKQEHTQNNLPLRVSSN